MAKKQTIPKSEPIKSNAHIFWSAELQTFARQFHLSPREIGIIEIIIREITNSEDIALEIDISTHTVNNHLKSIFEKTSTRSKTDVITKFFAFASSLKIAENGKMSEKPSPVRVLIIHNNRQYGLALAKELFRHNILALAAEPNSISIDHLARLQIDLIIDPASKELGTSPANYAVIREKGVTLKIIGTNASMAATPEQLATGIIGTDLFEGSLNEIALRLSQIIAHNTNNREFLQPFEPNHSQSNSATALESIETLNPPPIDLGYGGMFVPLESLGSSRIQVNVGSILNVSFMLPVPASIKLQTLARVMWKRPRSDQGLHHGVGIKFAPWTGSERQIYEQFILDFDIKFYIPIGIDRMAIDSFQLDQARLPTGA